ncbi:hypothetical protein HIM_04827 [Hirsutella minnesotensis 3608]|uniref:Ferric reductase NAD binding domain-containing protein n=1 Tax=Hirsutella minnesotensis 3608 TaxID=1043627 RepID=A0A0F7ZPK7_9HYPO|nr:hypothetical protein HIM_04827 [Hirsutella minnesotensis 3608]
MASKSHVERTANEPRHRVKDSSCASAFRINDIAITEDGTGLGLMEASGLSSNFTKRSSAELCRSTKGYDFLGWIYSPVPSRYALPCSAGPDFLDSRRWRRLFLDFADPTIVPHDSGRQWLDTYVPGISANPLVSMLRSMADAPPPGLESVSVVYATKLPASGRLRDVLFLETMASLLGSGPVRGTLRLHVSKALDSGATARIEEGERRICGMPIDVSTERVSREQVRQLVKRSDPDSTVVYICGPPTMTDELFAALTSPDNERILDPRCVLTEKWW